MENSFSRKEHVRSDPSVSKWPRTLSHPCFCLLAKTCGACFIRYYIAGARRNNRQTRSRCRSKMFCRGFYSSCLKSQIVWYYAECGMPAVAVRLFFVLSNIAEHVCAPSANNVCTIDSIQDRTNSLCAPSAMYVRTIDLRTGQPVRFVVTVVAGCTS